MSTDEYRSDELPEGRPAAATVTYLKLPPHSIASEHAVLAAVMVEPSLIDSLSLQASDFYRYDHQRLWNTVEALYRKQLPTDALSIMEAFQDDDSGIASYVMDIASQATAVLNPAAHARVILDHAARRIMIDASTRTIQALEDSQADLDDITNTYLLTLAAAQDKLTPDLSAVEPLDLWTAHEPPEMDPYYFPPAISAYAQERARLIGTHPSVIALSCLVACASVTHDGIKLQPMFNNTTYRESARLWGLVVGDPSSKKTSAIKAGVDRLRDIDAVEATANQPREAEYDRKLKIYKKAEAAYIKSEVSGSYSGDVPTPPEKPKKYRTMIQDATIEAMADILADNEGGMLVYKDELAGWFGAMDAYRSKGGAGSMDRAKWLEAYQGGRQTVDRVSRGTIVVPNWSVCLIGGVQPEKIASIVSQSDEDGLMARFMVVIASKNARDMVDAKADPAVLSRYYTILDELRSTQPPQDGRPVMYSEGAYAKWLEVTRFAKDHMVSGKLPPALCNHLGKWEGLFSRLCLAYHCIALATSNDHPCTVTINVKTADRVQRFMQEFLFEHAKAFYCETLDATDEHRVVQAVGELILAKQWKQVTRRDLQRNSMTFRRADTRIQNRVVQYLSDAGWMIPGTTKERFPNAWRINPRVHTKFTTRAEAARRAREYMAKSFRTGDEND